MAELKNWPYPLNQAGYKWPAQVARAQHYSATSGGNGVSSPGAMKVTSQPAPDGSIQILPGGADVVSTYPEAPEQTYYSHIFQPATMTVPPTGSSSGGRTDLVIRRVLDPEFEKHPEHSGQMTEEAAKLLDFEWIEVITGADENTNLTYPHVKLAKIVRPPNTTIVQTDHIVDLRELSNPQKDWHMEGRNLDIAETESLHSGSTVWPTPATHMMKIPDFTTRMKISAGVEMAKSHSTAGTAGHAAGNFLVYFIHPDGTEINTQQTTWRTSGQQNREDLTIQLTHTLAVPTKFRGETVRVEFRARKTTGPNVYADGSTSYRLVVFFEQEIA